MFINNYYHKYLFLVNNEYKLYSLNEAVDNNLIIHKNEIINKCIKIFKNIYLLNDNIYKLSTIYNKKIFINIIRYLQNNKISNIILPSEIYEEINTGYYINNKLYIVVKVKRNMINEIIIYTDGACKGNPGPGGWGVVIIENNNETEL